MTADVSGGDPESFRAMRLWLGQTLPQLAAMARVGYARDGRGCILGTAPAQPGTTDAHWFPASEIPVDAVTDHVRAMVAEYDPDTQFVIVVGLEGADECISAKIRLDSAVPPEGA